MLYLKFLKYLFLTTKSTFLFLIRYFLHSYYLYFSNKDQFVLLYLNVDVGAREF